MSACVRRPLAVLLLTVAMLFFARPSEAQNYPSLNNADFNFTTDIVLVVVAAAVVVTGVVVGIYFLARTPRVNGCVVGGADGLELLSLDGKKRYKLAGDAKMLALLKPGERVRVIGKKTKSDGSPQLLTQKLIRDYGACSAGTIGSPALVTP